MQAGRRLVEDVDGAARRPLLQLGGQLDALGLAARECRGGLTETDVSEADVDERLEVAVDRGDRLEEIGGLLDRHVENLRDGLALVVHLEGLAVVPRTVTHLAGNVDVGQEVHLDLDGSLALARLAASALDVEREPSWLVAAHLRFGRRCEQRADLVEDTRVGRRIRARCPTDRRLIDLHELVEVAETVHTGVPARNLTRTVELVRQDRREDVVDQRRLSGSGHTGDRGEHAERK